MENAFTAFISTLLIGAIFFGIIWWEGSYFSWRVTKWYFGILFAGALVVGGYTYSSGISFF